MGTYRSPSWAFCVVAMVLCLAGISAGQEASAPAGGASAPDSARPQNAAPMPNPPASTTSVQAASSSASTPLQFKAESALALRGGEGAVTFRVINTGAAPVAVTLLPGPIVERESHAVLQKAKAAFFLPSSAATADAAAGSALTATIAPRQELAIVASVTGIAGASAAMVPVYNGNSLLGELPVIAQDAPMNLTVDGDGGTNAPLAYTYSEPVAVVLKNGDAMPYRLRWEFQLDNQTLSAGVVEVPASGSVRVVIKQAACDKQTDASGLCTVFGVTDRVHPASRQGVMLVSLDAPNGSGSALLPSRMIPINLHMQRGSDSSSKWLSYVYAIFWLFIGGVLSVVATTVLPNLQAKSNMRAQLKDLANRTTSLSTRIDSYLRVLLRLERTRIMNDINEASVLLPSATEPLTPITDAIATLERRLALAESLDDLCRKHDAAAEMAPPSITDGIDNTLQAAADQLHSLALSDTEQANAKVLLAQAQDWLRMLDNPADVAKHVAANLIALKVRISKFPTDYAEDLKAALPGVWVILEPERAFQDPANIVAPMLFAIDHGIAAIHLALDFAMVRASIPVEPGSPAVAPLPTSAAPATAGAADAPQQRDGSPEAAKGSASVTPRVSQAALSTGPAASADPRAVPAGTPAEPPHPYGKLARSQRDRLLQHQPQLLELLGTLSWRALREARQLVAQMRDDIYEEDVLTEIAQKDQAEITFDTQKPRPYLPVFFTVTFKDDRYNGSAALDRLLCDWTFPDLLKEEGWKVCHYFSGTEKAATASADPQGAGQTAEANQGAALVAAPAAAGQTLKARWTELLRKVRRRGLPDLTATVRVQIRGQRDWESREVPIPPLKKTIQIRRTVVKDTRYLPELLRFGIAFGAALAGLVSGALGQLEKLDFVPATIAIVALGFGADSIKNLLTQAPRKG